MELKKTKLNGLDFWYNKNDRYVGQRIALGKYEEFESQLILEQVNKNSVAVDVGANIGYYTLLLAQVCKKVYAIEPESESFEILSKNVAANKLTNVVLIKAAAGETEEMTDLYKSNVNNGDHKMWTGGGNLKTEEIFCKRLDNILLNEPKIDLIKIDTQGWEPAVIEGAKEIVKRDRPIIFLEYSPNDYPKAGLAGRKMIKYLKSIYKNIWTIDNWYYTYSRIGKNIKPDTRKGYSDLWMKERGNIWDDIRGYKNIKIKKVIKDIMGYGKNK